MRAEFAGDHGVELGGSRSQARRRTRRSATTSRAPNCSRSLSSSCSRLLFFRSLVASLLPPLLGVPGDPRHVLRIADRLELHRPVGVRAQHRHRPRARAGDRLQPVHGLPLSRGVRRAGFGVEALRRTLATAGRTIVFSSLTVAAAVASLSDLPQELPALDGHRRRARRADRGRACAGRSAGDTGAAGPRVNALAPKRLQRAADRDARPAESGFWYRLSRFVIRRPGRVALLTAAR